MDRRIGGHVHSVARGFALCAGLCEAMARATMIIIAHLDKLLKRLSFLGSLLFFVFVPPLLCIWLYWAADREPPFIMLPHNPVHVTAGEWAHIVVPVKRDMTRNCSVTFDRFIFPDGAKGRFDLGSGAMSYEGIRDLEKRCPGCLPVDILIPPPLNAKGVGIPTENGASFVTELSYACNPTHAIKPIPVRSVIRLYIEAP